MKRFGGMGNTLPYIGEIEKGGWDIKSSKGRFLLLVGPLTGKGLTERFSFFIVGNMCGSKYLDIYFIYRYIMEVDEEKIYTYNISVGVCLWFCWLDVGLQLGCIGAVLM